jgi:hypothetical protein
MTPKKMNKPKFYPFTIDTNNKEDIEKYIIDKFKFI